MDLAPINISWWYLKRFKSYRVDKQTNKQTNKHYWKQYHIRYIRHRCAAGKITYGVYPVMGTLKPHSDGPLYSNRPTVFGTLAVDGWAVTFGTARRGLGELRPRLVPYSVYQM